jgi:cytochrome c553
MKTVIGLACVALIFMSGCDSKDESATQKPVPQAIKKGQNTPSTPSITVHKTGTEIEEDNPLIQYDIDGNRKMRVAPDGIETPLTKQIGAFSSIRNNYENLNAKLLAQKLSKNYIVKCSACHDDYANGVVGPSLLTKSSDDIYNMIEEYRRKTKVNELMKYLVSQMDDAEIRALADEIAEFNKEIRESQ